MQHNMKSLFTWIGYSNLESRYFVSILINKLFTKTYALTVNTHRIVYFGFICMDDVVSYVAGASLNHRLTIDLVYD